MDIPVPVGCTSCSWAQRPGQGTAQKSSRSWLAVSFQTEKQRHRAWPLLNLPELTFLCPWCRVTERIICKPEKWYYRITFSMSKGHTPLLVTGPGAQGGLHGGLRSPLPGGQRNLEGGRVTAVHPTASHHGCRNSNVWLWETALGFQGFRAPSPTAFPCWICPQELGQPDHKRGRHPPCQFSTIPQRPVGSGEVQES